jgi:uncharacterized protein (TIGR02284 family)
MNAGGDISILNGLIGATLDSARHYRKVAGNIGNPRIRALFEHLSTQRKQVAQTLQDQLAAVSGDPLPDGMPAAHASRLFGNLRHAMDYGYCALIDEVERGEDHVKAKYECALENGRLSGLSHTVVQNAYASVCEGRAEMHALKRYPGAEQRHGERLEQW